MFNQQNNSPQIQPDDMNIVLGLAYRVLNLKVQNLNPNTIVLDSTLVCKCGSCDPSHLAKFVDSKKAMKPWQNS